MKSPRTPIDGSHPQPTASSSRLAWPASTEVLEREQLALAAAQATLWTPSDEDHSIGGCFVCFPRGRSGPGARGDPAWAAAVLLDRNGEVETARVEGTAGAPYEAGFLALREGPLLEASVRALPHRPEILLVNATGRDHPRRAGLALHLGAILDLPTVGVTHRPLIAFGDWPRLDRGDRAPLELDGRTVGYWLCIQDGKRPLAVHAAWRTTPERAAAAVLAATTGRYRTPEPIRLARQVARQARARVASDSTEGPQSGRTAPRVL